MLPYAQMFFFLPINPSNPQGKQPLAWQCSVGCGQCQWDGLLGGRWPIRYVAHHASELASVIE